MANPDAKNLKSALGNQPKKFSRKKSGSMGSVNERTASWPGLPGKTGPNRSAGVTKAKIHPKSEGI